jgi:hypothetical protein
MMKKEKLKKRPYQLLDHDGNWQSTDAATFAPGMYFKPARLLALPNGALLALMVGLAADEWLIYSVDENGIPARSRILEGRPLGELAFHELAARLTEPHKDTIAEKLYSKKLPAKKRATAALELARLELADDELAEGIREEVERFVGTHTPAECEELYQRDLAKYDRTRAAVA